MSRKLTVLRTEEVQWPNRCAACGAKEGLVAAGASIGRVASVRPTLSGDLAIRGELLSLDYPVCKAHSHGLVFANLLTRKTLGLSFLRGMIWLLGPLSVLTLATALFRLLAEPGGGPGASLPAELMALFVLFAAAFVLLVRAYRKLPLRLVKQTGDGVTIRFRNEGYAVEFGRLNQAHVQH